jgi:phosphoglycolate phosphatase
MGKKFRLVIFDLDGTLIDNRAAIGENINYALKANGYKEADLGAIYRTIGLPLEGCFRAVANGIDMGTAMELARTYRMRYRETSHHGVVLLDGVPQVLAMLRDRGMKLAVATTKANEDLEPLLGKIGLLRYFDLALGRTEGMRMKPKPDMLNYIMKELGIGPSSTAMVGDTYMDVAAGRSAGAFAIGVLSGVRLGIALESELRESHPDAVIGSLSELEPLLVRR